MSIEVRKIETTYGETGVGQSDRVDVTYELGLEIGGAWIRFASVPETTVVQLQAAAKANAPAAPASPSPAASSSGGSEGPTMADVTPTPAPQQAAADSEAQQVTPDDQPPTETVGTV